MNRFDRPLISTATALALGVMGAALIATLTNTGSAALAWVCLLVMVVAVCLLIVSEVAYRKWHPHTSIVTGLWTERRPREHKPGRSFQSLTEVYPDVAVMRLKSGGTYALGDVNDAIQQPLEVRVGDTVIVQRAWGATNGHWHTQILSVVSADKLRPAKKADH